MSIKPEQSTAVRLSKALSRFNDVHSDMSLLQMMFLLQVAANPGITQRQLWGLLGVSDGVASRVLAILGPFGSRGTEPLKLVSITVDPNDRRSRILGLTPKGQRLIETIHEDLTRKA